jgi:methionyl-tRNA formyltransferase
MLLKALPQLLDGKTKPVPQDESKATFTEKFTTEDGFIPLEDLSASPEAAWRKIRALNPEPGAWTLKGDERVKLLRAELKNGGLVLTEIQRAGKKPEYVSRPLP